MEINGSGLLRCCHIVTVEVVDHKRLGQDGWCNGAMTKPDDGLRRGDVVVGASIATLVVVVVETGSFVWLVEMHPRNVDCGVSGKDKGKGSTGLDRPPKKTCSEGEAPRVNRCWSRLDLLALSVLVDVVAAVVLGALDPYCY